MKYLWSRYARWALALLILSACAAPAPPPTATIAASTTVPAVEAPEAPTATITFAPSLTPTGLSQRQAAGTPQTATPTPSPSPTPDPRLCLPAVPSEVGQVAWVINGQIIVVRIDGRWRSVRYLGIQAPAYMPNIRFMGPPAFRKNQELVQGQLVNLYRDGPDQDELGQLLRYVTTHDLFVNYELVRLGFAETSPGSDMLTCHEAFAQAQAAAEGEQIGLWGPAEVAMAETPATNTLMGGAAAVEPTAQENNETPSETLTTQSSEATATVTLTSAPSATAGSQTPTVTATRTLQATLTSTNTPLPGQPSATSSGPPTITATFTGTPNLFLNDFVYIGSGANQEDEYVEISNEGDGAAQMEGWKLHHERLNRYFTFPNYVLPAGGICRVYTNVVRADSCAGQSFNSSTQLWLDNQIDCVELLRPDGQQEDEYCNL